MKNSYRKDWSDESYNQFVLFYSMCGKKDRAFFDAPKEERNSEDYLRLWFIALAFGFKKMAMRILANIGPENNLKQNLKTFPKDFQTVTVWFDDFIKEIPIPEFRESAIQIWDETRETINEENFDIRDLLR